jgi:hypothetical protein
MDIFPAQISISNHECGSRQRPDASAHEVSLRLIVWHAFSPVVSVLSDSTTPDVPRSCSLSEQSSRYCRFQLADYDGFIGHIENNLRHAFVSAIPHTVALNQLIVGFQMFRGDAPLLVRLFPY